MLLQRSIQCLWRTPSPHAPWCSKGTVSCITHSLADKLGLTGTWTQRLVELAGEPAKLIDTKEYKMVVKMGGKQWKLILLGLQRKTSKPEPQDVLEAYQLICLVGVLIDQHMK